MRNPCIAVWFSLLLCTARLTWPWPHYTFLNRHKKRKHFHCVLNEKLFARRIPTRLVCSLYSSHMCDMFREKLFGKKKRNRKSWDDGGLCANKARPVLITALTHMFRQSGGTKWDPILFGCGTSPGEFLFSKTLISGPQISCQSRRIAEETAPNKSTTCQSDTHTHTHNPQQHTLENTHKQ